MGLAEILRSKKDELENNSMYDEYLSIIIRNARRLKELTGNILDIARIESQSINLNKQVVDIDSVISEAIRDIPKDQGEQDVKLHYGDVVRNEDVAPADGNVFVYIDKGRIIQVSNFINTYFPPSILLRKELSIFQE